MKFAGYIVWLVVSLVIVAVATVMTWRFQATIPEDCAACGMAAIGLVPYWFAAYLALLINCIVVPVHLTRTRRQRLGALTAVSWVLGAVSLLAVGWATTMFVIESVD